MQSQCLPHAVDNADVRMTSVRPKQAAAFTHLAVCTDWS